MYHSHNYSLIVGNSITGHQAALCAKGNLHILWNRPDRNQSLRPCRLPLCARNGAGLCRQAAPDTGAALVCNCRGGFRVRQCPFACPCSVALITILETCFVITATRQSSSLVSLVLVRRSVPSMSCDTLRLESLRINLACAQKVEQTQ